jgi:hypothetical protein
MAVTENCSLDIPRQSHFADRSGCLAALDVDIPWEKLLQGLFSIVILCISPPAKQNI